jgi:hypothetical protein
MKIFIDLENNMKKVFYIFLCLLISFSSFTLAEEQNYTDHSNEDSHHVHSNHIAIFAGLTSNLEHEHTDFSLGLDYEHRLPRWHNLLGIGIFGEIVFAEHTEYIVGVPVFLHPGGGLKFWLAPGLLMMETVADIPREHFILKENNNRLLADSESSSIGQEFLIRLGVGYDFHIKNISISPAMSADIINGHLALVYGIYFGIGF